MNATITIRIPESFGFNEEQVWIHPAQILKIETIPAE